MSEQGKKKVAVVGAGVAGVVTAQLLQQSYDVTLLEAGEYLGGHTNTHVVERGPDAGMPVDTGFIVMNDRTYPLLHRLLALWGVRVRWADMSFSVSCQKTGLEYGSRDLDGIFAQRRNLFRPKFLGMLRGVQKLWREGARSLESGVPEMTVRQYIEHVKIPRATVDDYLVPISAAIWSSPDTGIEEFPISTLLGFFKNHGLLGYLDQPRWQTVVGGSRSYMHAFAKRFEGKLRLRTPVGGVRVLREGAPRAEVTLCSGEREEYDEVVLATHADQALRLLSEPTPEQKSYLGAWSYQKNPTVLHTDERWLPKNIRAHASWNYLRDAHATGREPLSVTYDLTRLQGLATATRYLVTLNPRGPIDPKKVLAELPYEHPMYSLEAARSQPKLPELNESGPIRFCGSYFRWGFHEDAVRSAVALATKFGVTF